MLRRSVLFSPADRPALVRKAPDSGADVVVADLEDAVAPADRPAARQALRKVLADPGFDPDAEVVVRVNPVGVAADDDLAAVLAAGPDAVMLPKADGADDVRTLHRLMAERGEPRPVYPLLETAAGVLAADGVAAATPTTAVVFGAEDLAADIGADRTADGGEVAYARQRVVLAAAAAGVDAVDTVHTDLEDRAGLREAAAEAAGLGFDGKLAVHPDQVAPIHEGFRPDEDRLAWARRVVAAAEDEEGVFRLDGEMIDAPLVARAERLLARAADGSD